MREIQRISRARDRTRERESNRERERVTEREDSAWNVLRPHTEDLAQDLAMGWLRLVGSLKSQVSFAEYCLFYGVLLQKRLIILRSLLIEATPYTAWTSSCGVLQSVAVCYCVLQRVASCCSAVQCVAVCRLRRVDLCSHLQVMPHSAKSMTKSTSRDREKEKHV